MLGTPKVLDALAFPAQSPLWLGLLYAVDSSQKFLSILMHGHPIAPFPYPVFNIAQKTTIQINDLSCTGILTDRFARYGMSNNQFFDATRHGIEF